MLSLWLYCPKKVLICQTEMMHVEDVIILPDKKMTEDVDITYGETEKKKKKVWSLYFKMASPLPYGLFVTAFLFVHTSVSNGIWLNRHPGHNQSNPSNGRESYSSSVTPPTGSMTPLSTAITLNGLLCIARTQTAYSTGVPWTRI